MLSALGPAALGFWAYISGKSLVLMLQLLHILWHKTLVVLADLADETLSTNFFSANYFDH